MVIVARISTLSNQVDFGTTQTLFYSFIYPQINLIKMIDFVLHNFTLLIPAKSKYNYNFNLIRSQ